MEKRNVLETMEGCPPWHPLGFCEVNDVIIRTFVAEGQFPWHLHREHEEFFLTIKGEITVETNQENFVLKEGDTLVVPPNVLHRPTASERSIGVLIPGDTDPTRADIYFVDADEVREKLPYVTGPIRILEDGPS